MKSEVEQSSLPPHCSRCWRWSQLQWFLLRLPRTLRRRRVRSYSLVGTWDVTLSIPGQPPGRVLATFAGDGTTVESAAAPGTIRGASHGVWERVEPSLFSVTRVFFRFNPQTGAFLGTQKVNATVRVASDRKTFIAVSISEQRDPAGNLIVGGLRGTGTRGPARGRTDPRSAVDHPELICRGRSGAGVEPTQPGAAKAQRY